MVEFLKTLAIACIPAIITGIVTYIVARKNAASQISIIKEQNKHDLEKLMEQHKVDIEHLKEAHRLDMEAKEQDHTLFRHHAIAGFRLLHRGKIGRDDTPNEGNGHNSQRNADKLSIPVVRY